MITILMKFIAPFLWFSCCISFKQSSFSFKSPTDILVKLPWLPDPDLCFATGNNDKYGFGIRSPNPVDNTAKRSLPKNDGAMKTKIGNLFELSALKNFLHSRVFCLRDLI